MESIFLCAKIQSKRRKNQHFLFISRIFAENKWKFQFENRQHTHKISERSFLYIDSLFIYRFVYISRSPVFALV